VKLTLSEVHPGCVAVQCEADSEIYQSLKPGRPVPNPLPVKDIIWFDATKSTITIRPIITYPSERYFEAKYDQIEEIVLEGFEVEPPDDENAVHDALFHLPAGFIKNIDAGLGFPKEYRSIVDSVEEIDGISTLVITKRGATRLDGPCFYVAYREFEKLRLSLARITRGYQREGRIDRAIQSHNVLLTTLDPKRFPAKRQPLKKDTISKLLVGRDHSKSELSKGDRSGLVAAVRSSAPKFASETPHVLYELQRDIELVSLDVLIVRFREMLDKKLPESAWQKLFASNPFILSMLFGYPIVEVLGQAHVGGTALTGRGGKIADFLIKNQGTNNAALIEIKTPHTPLLGKEFRGGVYPASNDLVGSVAQVLDQRYQFQKNIAQIKDATDIADIVSYSVDCVVVAGRTPEGKAEQKCLELFRRSMKDVQIYAFDELLQKLVQLRDFLASDEPSIDGSPVLSK
jgi:antiviral defense system Shedu protein SduA